MVITSGRWLSGQNSPRGSSIEDHFESLNVCFKSELGEHDAQSWHDARSDRLVLCKKDHTNGLFRPFLQQWHVCATQMFTTRRDQ